MKSIVVALLLVFAVCGGGASAQSGRVKQPSRENSTVAAPTPNQKTDQKTERESESPKSTSEETISVAAEQPATTDDEVIHVETALVTIPVTVFDRLGFYVSHLQKENFRVYENDVLHPIAYFADVEQPVTVALLLDVSGSTVPCWRSIQTAAAAFVRLLRPGDRVLLIAFESKIHQLTEPTVDRFELLRKIECAPTGCREARVGKIQIYSGGQTKLYEAVEFALEKLEKTGTNRQAVVLLTDGIDTKSRRGARVESLSRAEEAGAAIYSIEYSSPRENDGCDGAAQPFPTRGRRPNFPAGVGFPTRRRPGGFLTANDSGSDIFARINPTGGQSSDGSRGTYLEDLARVTGGRVYESGKLSVAAAFAQIGLDLRSQYSLGYYPQNVPQPGERRFIKVKVDQPNMAVRARDSYTVRRPPAAASPPPKTK